MSAELMGSQEPTHRIAPEYRETDGADAATLLRSGGLTLDPWQRDVLDDWMGLTPGNRWAAPTAGGSVPRQNGKTLLVQGRCAGGMLLYRESIIYTAHLQKTATETFEELRDFFSAPKLKKYVEAIKTALGREQIILRSGARIKFLARTRNGGRGQHGDLLIFDEAQELDESQQASFLPAISASLNPQTIYVGTPPDPTAAGTVFRTIRQRALSGESNRTAWFEFSVPEIGDVDERQRWAACNPALGRRMLLSTIESEREQMDEDTFARERLGWWSPVNEECIEYAIPAEAWDRCRSEEPKPTGKTAYGVKFSPDGAQVCLCAAVVPPEGPARVGLVELRTTGSGLQWLSEWLNERYRVACCVVVDGKNGVDALTDKLQRVWRFKGSVLRAGVRDVIASVSTLTDAVNEGSVTWHASDELLRESAVTSVRRPIAGGWGFGGESSLPVEAAALALWGAKTCKRNPGAEMRIG